MAANTLSLEEIRALDDDRLVDAYGAVMCVLNSAVPEVRAQMPLLRDELKSRLKKVASAA